MGDKRAGSEKALRDYHSPIEPIIMKPLRVTVNGRESQHTLKPSLLDALRSYERRHDWGLVYHAEVTLDGDAILNK